MTEPRMESHLQDNERPEGRPPSDLGSEDTRPNTSSVRDPFDVIEDGKEAARARHRALGLQEPNHETEACEACGAAISEGSRWCNVKCLTDSANQRSLSNDGPRTADDAAMEGMFPESREQARTLGTNARGDVQRFEDWKRRLLEDPHAFGMFTDELRSVAVAAAEERIVAWLRDRGTNHADTTGEYLALHEAASAIKRGEHRA